MSMRISKKREPVYYFAYGSNMDPVVMIKRGIEYQKRLLGILYEYELLFNKLARKDSLIGYANINYAPNKVTEGALYIIDERGLKKLDKYEGFPDHYDKYIGTIHTKKIGSVEAYVYVAQMDKTSDNLLPTKEYLSHLLAGKDLFSTPYYEQLKNVKTIDG